jgi:hypothetical protein
MRRIFAIVRAGRRQKVALFPTISPSANLKKTYAGGAVHKCARISFGKTSILGQRTLPSLVHAKSARFSSGASCSKIPERFQFPTTALHSPSW